MNLSRWDHKTLKRIAIFVLALVSLGILVREIIGPNGYLTYQRKKKEYFRLQQQVQALSQQNQQLKQKISALKNNPEAVEKQARDQLHLAKPGELIYMLPDKKPAQTADAAPQNSPAPIKSRR